MRLLKLAVIALVAGYVLLCGALFFFQRRLVFPAPVDRAPVPRNLTELRLPGGSFLLWRQVEGDGPVVVHFHGNGEQVAHLGWLAAEYAQRGVSFVAVEYPGYPGAAGEPSEASLLATAQEALEMLTSQHGVARERLVLEGQSVGTGVAVAMAARGWGVKLVLLSPYTSLPDVAARAFPWVPVRLLMRDRFDSGAQTAQLNVPTLVVHGTHDEVIPFELGQRLAQAISGAKFVAVERGDHNGLWDRREVTDAIFGFVQ